MYKEYLENQENLKKAYIELLKIIIEEKNYNEEKLELLLSIGKNIILMNEAMSLSITECTFQNNNYNILSKLLEILEEETDEKWNLDYCSKTSDNDKIVLFLVIKKEELPLDFISTKSYEELHHKAQFGNKTKDYIIYDEIQGSWFELGYYLTKTKPYLHKFFKIDYNFSANYPMLQEEIINMVMNSYKTNYKKVKNQKK